MIQIHKLLFLFFCNLTKNIRFEVSSIYVFHGKVQNTTRDISIRLKLDPMIIYFLERIKIAHSK